MCFDIVCEVAKSKCHGRIVKETIELVDQEAIRVLDEATQTVGQPKGCGKRRSFKMFQALFLDVHAKKHSLDRHCKPQ